MYVIFYHILKICIDLLNVCHSLQIDEITNEL